MHPLSKRSALQRRTAVVAHAAAGPLPFDLTGLALFFAPGAAMLLYALIKGKGNLTDGLSRLLTEASQVAPLG
jgi:cytochrome P450 family 97 subfamily B polypeptide 3